MLRLLYYRYKKSGKIRTKKGGGLIIRHGRIIRILRHHVLYGNVVIYLIIVFTTKSKLILATWITVPTAAVMTSLRY